MGGLALVRGEWGLVAMDWQGNVTMQVQLGTDFWLFLVVAIAVLVLWFTGYLSKVRDTVMNSFG